ncbi:MAG TPA: hypothetical protein VMV94_19320 [Phycisphaerae bacterium]|nr:hypothetical protein [Phycisphaerae bacterium]
MTGLFFFLAIGIPLALGAYGIRASMHRQNAARPWRITWWLLLLCGAAAGYALSFLIVIPASKTLRFAGFPFILSMLHSESGNWVDLVTDRTIRLSCAVGNMLIWATLFTLPLALRFGFFRPRRRSRGKCQACGYDLTSNISGRCPECGLEIPLAASRTPDEAGHHVR